MSLHFVLDGYNLIKQDAGMAKLQLEAGRQALLRLIETQNLQGSPRNTVTIVFDGQMGGDDSRYASGIRVIFTSGESADDRIKRMVDESASPKNMVVVTDDREIRYFVRALGARLAGSREFLRRNGTSSPKKFKSASTGKNMSHVAEGKITSDMAKIWLKGKH